MIYLVVATISDRKSDLSRFIASIHEECLIGRVKLIIVYQSDNDFWSHPHAEVIHVGYVGASAARNIGLKRVNELATDADYVGFPDDDCWYGSEVVQKLSESKSALIFGDVLDPSGNIRLGAPVPGRTRNLRFLFPYINCPSFFVKHEVLKSFSGFNESFGPGAKIPAVEESEFLVRLSFEKTISCEYNKSIKIYHPLEIPNPSKNFQYSLAQGYLFRKLLEQRRLFAALVYFKVLLRPFAGFLVSAVLFNCRQIKFYACRCYGIYRGISIE